jgi:3-mercaptopyruvate sulfurtransferase SseA
LFIYFGEILMMRRVFIPAVLALAAAALLGACKATDSAGNLNGSAAQSKPGEKPNTSAPTGTTEVHADGVRRVTVAQLQAMLKEGGTVIYDTRSKSAYDAEHIQGALSMPYDEVMNRAGELPKDKTLVFYCT